MYYLGVTQLLCFTHEKLCPSIICFVITNSPYDIKVRLVLSSTILYKFTYNVHVKALEDSKK